MSGEIGKMFERNVEEGLECGDVGGLGGAMLLLHHGHYINALNQHHSVNRVRQQEGVGWSDGQDQSVQQGA